MQSAHCFLLFFFPQEVRKELFSIQTHTDKNRAAKFVLRIILTERTKYISDGPRMRVSKVYCWGSWGCGGDKRCLAFSKPRLKDEAHLKRAVWRLKRKVWQRWYRDWDLDSCNTYCVIPSLWQLRENNTFKKRRRKKKNPPQYDGD